MGELADDKKIDKHALDHEWVEQPDLYEKWANRAADAEEDQKFAKSQRELVRAEIDEDIRLRPKKWSFDKKPTEAAILNKIQTSLKFQEAEKEYIKAYKRYRVMENAKEKMHQRKAALEGLTKLWLGQYYSSPAISKEARDQIPKATEAGIKEKVKFKLNRKRS